MPLFNPYPQADQPSISIWRTTTYTFTASFADITMDTTGVNNDTTYLTHDGVNTQRINILVSGLYEVTYQFQTAAQATAREVYGQVVQNASTVLNGSSAAVGVYSSAASDGPSTVTATFLAQLSAGDYIRLQAYSSSTAATMVVGATLAAVRLTGGKGDTGPAGTVPYLSPVTASGTITTTAANTAPVVATSMTLTPAAGTYYVTFKGNGWISNSGTVGYYAEASIFAGGVQATDSMQQFSDAPSYNTPFFCDAVVVVSGSQAIEGRWGVAGGGTGTMYGTRTMNFLKIG